jgi:hypothetical protein
MKLGPRSGPLPEETASTLALTLEADGFVTVRDFFSIAEVDEARAEILEVLERDRLMRKEARWTAVNWTQGPTPSSALAAEMHTVLFPTMHSPALARMIERILTDPMSSALLRKAVGEHYRLRVDLVRRSSGARDEGFDGDLPHSWHRDRPGEFTVGIFFDDLGSDDRSATAAVPGTHMLPFNPIWDFLLSRPAYLSQKAFKRKLNRYCLNSLYERAPHNEKLRAWFAENGRGILGKKGDWYLFFNDTWHGRQANLSGEQLVMVRFGGFATDYAFPDDIARPAATDHLPETLGRRYQPVQPVNVGSDSILGRMKARQDFLSMFIEANAEKRNAVRVSSNVLATLPFLNFVPGVLARPRR